MKEFLKQVEAHQACGTGEYVWAMDVSPKTRAKKYIVASVEEFWNLLNGLKPKDRNGYEQIRDYASCKPYFDFDIEITPETDVGETLAEIKTYMDTCNAIIIKELKLGTGLVAHVCDSSNNKKISKHIVLEITKDDKIVLLENYEHCKNLCMRVLDMHPNLKMKPDMSVYSKNRVFRTVGCTKIGQERFLVYTKDSLLLISQTDDMPSRECFITNLVSIVPDVPTITVRVPPTKRRISPNYNTDDEDMPECAFAIASMINDCWSVFSDNPNVRPWTFMPMKMRITFKSDSKYCKTYGGDHENNHVWFMADLELKIFHQRCFSPKQTCYEVIEGESSRFQSSAIPFTPEVSAEVDEFLKSYCERIDALIAYSQQ